MNSITPIEMKHTIMKIAQQYPIGIALYIRGPIHNRRFVFTLKRIYKDKALQARHSVLKTLQFSLVPVLPWKYWSTPLKVLRYSFDSTGVLPWQY